MLGGFVTVAPMSQYLINRLKLLEHSNRFNTSVAEAHGEDHLEDVQFTVLN
jgi:hypothetical protein